MHQNNYKPQRKQANTPYTTPERNDYFSKMPEYKARTELISRKKASNDQADSSMSKYSNNSFSHSSNFNMSDRNSNSTKNFLSATPKNQSILESPHLIQINTKNTPEKYKKLSNKNDNNSANIKDESDIIESLQSQNKALRDSIGNKDDQLLQLNQKLRKAVRHIKSHKIKKEIAEQELEKAKNDYLQSQNENEDKDKIIFQLYSDIKSLKNSNEDDHNKINRITSLYRQMEMNLGNQIKKLQENISSIKSDRDDSIKAMKKNIASLQSENDSLKIAITEYEATHNSLQEEKEDIKNQNNLLQEKYTKLKEKCQFSESESYNEIEELKEQNALLNTRNLELAAQNESLKKQLSSPNKLQSSSSMKLEKLQEALREKDETINKLQNEIKALCQSSTPQLNMGNEEDENDNDNINRSQNQQSVNISALIRENNSLKEANQKLNNDLQNQKKLFEMEKGKLKEQIRSLNGVSTMNDSLAYQLYELQNENSRMRENLEHISTTTFQSDPLLHEIRSRQKENEQMNQIQNLSKMAGNISNNDFDFSLLNSMTNDSLVKEILKLRSQNEALKKEIDKINTQSMISNIENNSNSGINKNSRSSNIGQSLNGSFGINEANNAKNKAKNKYTYNNQNNNNKGNDNENDDDDDEKNYSYSTFDEDSFLHTIKKQQKESSSGNAKASFDANDDQLKNNSNIASYIEDDSMIKIIQENEELQKLAEKVCQNSSFSKSLIENNDQIDKNTEIKDEIEEENMNEDNNYNIIEKKLEVDIDYDQEEEEALLDDRYSNNAEEEEKETFNIKEDNLFIDNDISKEEEEEEEDKKSSSNKNFANIEGTPFVDMELSNEEEEEEQDNKFLNNRNSTTKGNELLIDNDFGNDEEEEALLDYIINEEEEEIDEKMVSDGNNYNEKLLDENNFDEEEEDILDDNLEMQKNKEENNYIDINEANNDENDYIGEEEDENADHHSINRNFEIEEEEEEESNNDGIINSMQNASDDLLHSESDNELNVDDEKKNEEEEEEDLKEGNLLFDHSPHSSSDSHSNHSQNNNGSKQDENLDFFRRPNMNSNNNENLSDGEVPQNSNFENNDFDNSNLSQQLNQVCSENEQLKAQNSILHDEISDLQEHLQNLVAVQLQNTLEELDDVQKGSQELRQRSYNLELLQMENSNLKHRVINLEAQNIDLRKIIIDNGVALSNNASSGNNSQMNSSYIQKSNDNQNISNNSIRKSPKNDSKSEINAMEEDLLDDDANSMGILKEKAEQMRSVINTIRNASSASSTAEDEKEVDNDNDESKKKNSSDSLSLLDYRTLKRENVELKEIISKFDINASSGKKNDSNNSDDGYNAQLIDKVQQLELTNAELVQRIEEISQNESQIVDRYEEENQGLRDRITHLETQLSEAVEAESKAREMAISAKIAAVEASCSTANSYLSLNNSGDQESNEIKSSFNDDISPQISSGLSPSQREEIQNVFEGFKSRISELQQSLSDIQKENSILESKMNEQMLNASATESALKQERENLQNENEILRKTIFSIQSSYSNQEENDDDDENILKIDNELDDAEEDFGN